MLLSVAVQVLFGARVVQDDGALYPSLYKAFQRYKIGTVAVDDASHSVRSVKEVFVRVERLQAVFARHCYHPRVDELEAQELKHVSLLVVLHGVNACSSEADDGPVALDLTVVVQEHEVSLIDNHQLAFISGQHGMTIFPLWQRILRDAGEIDIGSQFLTKFVDHLLLKLLEVGVGVEQGDLLEVVLHEERKDTHHHGLPHASRHGQHAASLNPGGRFAVDHELRHC